MIRTPPLFPRPSIAHRSLRQPPEQENYVSSFRVMGQIKLKSREFVVIQILVANSCKWMQFYKCVHGYNVRPKRITVKCIISAYSFKSLADIAIAKINSFNRPKLLGSRLGSVFNVGHFRLNPFSLFVSCQGLTPFSSWRHDCRSLLERRS